MMEDCSWDATDVVLTAAGGVGIVCLYLFVPGIHLAWLYALAGVLGIVLALRQVDFAEILRDAWKGASDSMQVRLALAGVVVVIAVPVVAGTWLLRICAPQLISVAQGASDRLPLNELLHRLSAPQQLPVAPAVLLVLVIVFICLVSLGMWLSDRWTAELREESEADARRERERQEAVGVEAE